MWTPDPSIIITAEQKAAEAAIAERQAQFPNLEPDQFWFIIRASGYEPDLRAWVESMRTPLIAVDSDGEPVENPDFNPVAWAAASAKLDFARYFKRDHPFVEAAREAIGMSILELDTLWGYAQ